MKTKTTLAALLLAAVMVPASTQAAPSSKLLRALFQGTKNYARQQQQQKETEETLTKLMKDKEKKFLKMEATEIKKWALSDNEVDRLLLMAIVKDLPKGTLQKLVPADELLESMLKAKVPQQDAEKRLVELYGKDWKTPKEKAPAE